MTHAIWWPVNDIHHVYSQKPCMFTFHCKGSLRQRRWYKVEEFSEKSDRPGRCSFDILFCKSVVFHQISALWVMIIRVILWRSCSPWWPEMDTVLRSVRYHSSSSVQLSTIQEQWIIKGNSGDWLVCMCLCLQVQESFAACALDVKRVYDENRGKPSLEWSNSSLSHVASLLLRANKTQHAWWERQLYICLSVCLSVCPFTAELLLPHDVKVKCIWLSPSSYLCFSSGTCCSSSKPRTEFLSESLLQT